MINLCHVFVVGRQTETTELESILIYYEVLKISHLTKITPLKL